MSEIKQYMHWCNLEVSRVDNEPCTQEDIDIIQQIFNEYYDNSDKIDEIVFGTDVNDKFLGSIYLSLNLEEGVECDYEPYTPATYWEPADGGLNAYDSPKDLLNELLPADFVNQYLYRVDDCEWDSYDDLLNELEGDGPDPDDYYDDDRYADYDPYDAYDAYGQP